MNAHGLSLVKLMKSHKASIMKNLSNDSRKQLWKLTGCERQSKLQLTIIHMKSYLKNIRVSASNDKLFKKVKHSAYVDKVTLLQNMKDLDEKRTKTL